MSLMQFLLLILIPICSVMNRARGSQFWDLLPSTVASRLCATLIMATAIAGLTGNLLVLPAVWGGLMLWCSPGWDADWSAEIGNDPAHSKGWGVAMMTVRMLLIVPTFIGLAYLLDAPDGIKYAAIPMLFALPYYVFGAIDKSTAIPRSEYTVGALIGLTFYLIII